MVYTYHEIIGNCVKTNLIIDTVSGECGDPQNILIAYFMKIIVSC